MRRKYLDRVSVYKNTAATDGYGGNTLTESLLGNSWASVETLSGEKQVLFGLDILKPSIRIKTRWRKDLDYEQAGLFFRYKSKDWYPVSIVNEGLENEEITIIATKK